MREGRRPRRHLQSYAPLSISSYLLKITQGAVPYWQCQGGPAVSWIVCARIVWCYSNSIMVPRLIMLTSPSHSLKRVSIVKIITHGCTSDAFVANAPSIPGMLSKVVTHDRLNSTQTPVAGGGAA